MRYVTEFGPLRVAGKQEKQWVVLLVDLDPRAPRLVWTHLAPTQARARRAVSMQVGLEGRRDVQCSESLGRFGQGRGWQVAKAPPLVSRAAALVFTSLDQGRALGGCAFSPELAELLEACARFIRAEPWTTRLACDPQVLPSGAVAGVFQNALVLLPSVAAFRAAQSRSPRVSALPDVLLLAASPTDERARQAFGVGFALTLLCKRAGQAAPFSFDDLRRLTDALLLFAQGAEDEGAVPRPSCPPEAAP